jgi:ligand-binding sensor domain-containing protein/signal transduction histidine kinase
MIRNLAMVTMVLFQVGGFGLFLPSLYGDASRIFSGLADMKQKTWTQEQGLPGNSVECLLQTRDGWLWIGTRDGLARFDGVRFTIFNGRTPGFTDDAILDLAEDGEQNLWIATKKGLYRKQGGHFTKFTSTNGLVNDCVTQLKVGRDGSLWVATQGGLSHFGGDGFTQFPFVETIGDQAGQQMIRHQISAVTEDTTGTLWLATEGGLYQFDPNQKLFVSVRQNPVPVYLDQLGPTRAVFADRNGNIWCGTDRVLSWLMAGAWQQFHLESDESDSRLYHIRQGPDGTIWIVHAGQLLRMEGEVPVHEENRLGLGDSYITDLLFDREGLIWVSTRYRGLACFSPTTLRVFTTRDGLCHNTTTSVCASGNHGVWVGTAKGLMQWRDGNFVFPEGTPSARRWNCRSVFEEPNGDVWVAAVETSRMTTKVLSREGSSYRLLNVMASANEPSAFLCDHRERLWIGGRTSLSCFVPGFQSNAWEAPNVVTSTAYAKRPFSWNFSAELTRKANPSIVLAEFSNNVWRAVNSVANPFTNWTSWSLAPAELVADLPIRLGQRLSAYDARWLLEDKQGTLWVGTWAGGLNRIREGLVDVFSKRDGLADDQVRALYLDEQDALWIGTSHGLSRISKIQDLKNPPQIVSFTTREGLPDNVVNQILEDSTGHLWIGCSAGIYRVARTDLDLVASRRAARVECLLLDEQDGMLATDTHSGSQPNACKTADGRLWFTTGYGLVMVDPARITRRSSMPQVFIERIQTGGKWIELLDSIPSERGQFPAGTRPSLPLGAADNQSGLIFPSTQAIQLPAGSGDSLAIQFTALDYSAPHRLRFRYRLIGVNSEWREAIERRSVSYANLKPNTYRFEVQACGRDLIWNTPQTSLAFAITPFIWQTQWFKILVFSITTSLAFVLVFWRFRILGRLHTFEKAQMLLTERDRMARDLHDDLAGDLVRIVMLDTNLSGSRPAEIARGALEKLSDLIWATDPNFDALSDLAAYLRLLIHHWTDKQKLSLRLEFPERLPPQRVTNHFRRQLTLVVKEALSNAVRHGQPSQITVGLQISPSDGKDALQVLMIWIQDNGRGFDPCFPASESIPRPSQSGRGLRSMRQRVEDLGGELSIESASGKGTTIRLSVPLSPNPNPP